MRKFDLIIIGGGPGGYTAALEGARLEMNVALIERDRLGGVCLNTGCIPSKTLIHEAHLYRQFSRRFGETGIDAASQFPGMMSNANSKAEALRNGIESLLTKAGVEVIRGTASFTPAKTIKVDTGEEIEAAHIIIAAGSSPAMPEFLPVHRRILNSESLWQQLGELPGSLAVLGGGVIGCELASAMAELGVSVTIFELADDILPGVDHELVRALKREFANRNIRVLTGAGIDSVTADDTGVKLTVKDEMYTADYLLVAAGRVPNTAELNLAAAGIECDRRGFIITDESSRTCIPSIYAIGDITGKLMLAHVASAMGRSAVDTISGSAEKVDFGNIPAVVFTNPELAATGITEKKAKELNIQYNIGRFPFGALGRAVAEDAADGLVKLIVEASTGKLLGAHIAGNNAGELISAMTIAVKNGITAAGLGHTVQAHPTYAEALSEAAEAASDRSLGLPLRRKKIRK